MLNSKVLLYQSLFLVVALASLSWASIENKPVKVTHQNSGPRYDIDEVEKTRLTPEREDGQPQMGRLPFSPMRPASSSPSSDPQEGPDGEHPTMGHINIRRIFLIPVNQLSEDSRLSSPAASSIWSGSRGQAQPKESSDEHDGESMLSRPMWPFLAPTRHLFGADQASRSPTADESFERPTMAADRSQEVGAPPNREREDAERQRPPFDAIQMMLEMMQQALSNAMLTPNTDLNKETGAKPDSDNKPESSETSFGSDPNGVPKRTNTELESPFGQPASNNSTKEEVVEIEGKKYLKKTVVNRHVGENIIFMTKRLLFVPLNETSELPAQPEQTGTSTVKASPESVTPEQPSNRIPSSTTSPLNEEPRKNEEATTTITSTTPAETPSSTTTTTTTTTEAPSTTTSTSTVSSTTENRDVEETTPREEPKDKASDTKERISRPN